ncbi:TetR family transcriptional regulator [Paraoerskovia marina]|uniref:TetR family transcriptional regulator n=1 Tax=Paraoerskovia marina TaxID=545619 RepID=UPI00069496E1|nr:TetR/AcrR family transcriptional regulator C-terminal domain-containing protein [Paraoerskovia marina]
MAERLDRSRVARRALELLDDGGLDALTLRRLAADLGVKAPALLWHFRDKGDLLDEMAAMMLADLVEAADWTDVGAGWEACMRESAETMRGEIARRPDGARLFARTFANQELGRAAITQPVQLLVEAGFAVEDSVRAWRTLLGFVLGFVVQEQAGGSADADAQFAFGVDVVVDGVAARVDLAGI